MLFVGLTLFACQPTVPGPAPILVQPALPPPPQEIVQDEFVLRSSSRVDVLLAVDPTQTDDLQEVATDLPVLLGPLVGSGIDYQIGVVSTDLGGEGGALRSAAGFSWVDAETPNPEAVLTAMLTLGEPQEEEPDHAGLDAIATALGSGAGFRRAGAPVHTLVLSSVDDASAATVPAFVAWYDGLARSAEDRTFSALVPEGAVRYPEAAATIGPIAGLAEGEEGDWSFVLDTLGHRASGIRTEFFLSQRPLVGTLEVQVGTLVDGEHGSDDRQDFEPACYDADGSLLNPDPAIVFEYDPASNGVSFASFVPDARSIVIVTYAPVDGTTPQATLDPCAI